MRCVKFCSVVFSVICATAARAEPVCDPADAGSRVMLSMEVTDVKDGAPYRSDVDWMLDRTTTVLPLCNYFSPVGSYSLKSYSLDPVTTTERVLLCHITTPVAPYAGPCPPK
jgi:hypothetical protein